MKPLVTGEKKIWTILTVFAEEAVGEAEFAGALVGVSATVTGEQLLSAGGLRSGGAVVHEPPAVEEVGHGGEKVPDGVKELGIGGQGPEDQEDGDGCEPHGGGVCSLSRLTLDTMMIVWPCLHSAPHHTLSTRALPGL